MLVTGYLGWHSFPTRFAIYGLDGREQKTCGPVAFSWVCYLWSLGRCCSERGRPVLEDLLRGVGVLSLDRSNDHGGTERYERFGMPLRCVGRSRFPLSSVGAEAWANVAAQVAPISHALFSATLYVEDPVLVEAFIRWYVTAKPIFLGIFVRHSDVLREPQPVGQDSFPDIPVYRSKTVLHHLWKMATEEPDVQVRQVAFAKWKWSASAAELPQLQSITENSELFGPALEVRARLGDEFAGPSLARKIKEDPSAWCGYAPRLYCVPEVRKAFLENYGLALGTAGYEECYAPLHLPSESVAEFVQRLRPVLLTARRTWIPLLLTGVPEALALVQEAIMGAAQELEHLFFDLPYCGGPITRRMLDALVPVLYRIPTKGLRYLVEKALKDGQTEWVLHYLSDYISSTDPPGYRLTEADIIAALNEIEEEFH